MQRVKYVSDCEGPLQVLIHLVDSIILDPQDHRATTRFGEVMELDKDEKSVPGQGTQSVHIAPSFSSIGFKYFVIG